MCRFDVAKDIASAHTATELGDNTGNRQGVAQKGFCMSMVFFMVSDGGVSHNTLSLLKFFHSFTIEWE